MKFAMSYSCGKDSTLALHKMLGQGHECACLIVMVNEAAGRSYFHGADPEMLECYEEALGIPLVSCPSGGENYGEVFESALARAKAMGAGAACFGDIDLEPNRRWEEERCAAAGLEACFPLWQQGREDIVRQLLGLGYKCLIKSVNAALLPEELAGRVLDEETAALMKAAGCDVCGENGEYHTLAVDGPVFRRPLPFRVRGVLRLGDYATADIVCEKEE